MKRIMVFAAAATVLLSSCDTYTGAGAYTGATLGSIFGSAIGGIAGGPRGSDYGTVVGMAVGAAVGGSVGAQADERENAKRARVAHYHAAAKARSDSRYYSEVTGRDRYHEGSETTDDMYLSGGEAPMVSNDHYGSGFDSTNSGDDRIPDFTSDSNVDMYNDGQTSHTGVSRHVDELNSLPSLEIREAHFVDANQDGVLKRGERGEIIFEVINRGHSTVYDILPVVTKAESNSHIHISPSMHVDQILPGKGIRYTAVVKADRGLCDGNVRFCLNVMTGQETVSTTVELSVPTRR